MYELVKVGWDKLVGERTKEAKVMGVYGAAQTALATFGKIMDKFPNEAAVEQREAG